MKFETVEEFRQRGGRVQRVSNEARGALNLTWPFLRSSIKPSSLEWKVDKTPVWCRCSECFEVVRAGGTVWVALMAGKVKKRVCSEKCKEAYLTWAAKGVGR